MKVVLIFFIIACSIILNAAYGGIDITSNLFRSPDNYYDMVFRAGHSGEFMNNAFALYWSIDGSMPVLNYEMSNLFMSFMLNRNNQPGPGFSVSNGMVILSNLYFMSYTDNMSFKGDAYTDIRKQRKREIYKLSADITAEHFPFLPDARRESGEIRAKFIYNSSIGAALHLGINAGVLYYDRLKDYAYMYAIEPLISKSIGDNAGLSIRGTYSRAFSDSMPYFIDDSFINNYYYDNLEAGIGIKFIMPEKGTVSFNASAGKRKFNNVFSMTDSIAFTDRNDTFINFTLRFITAGDNSSRWEYTYEKGVSDLADFTYDSHTFSVTVGI